MIYTENDIALAKACASPMALAYIQELEHRLQALLPTLIAEDDLDLAGLAQSDAVLLQEPATVSEQVPMTNQKQQNKLGDEITLYLDPDAETKPHIIWYGLCGYSDVTFTIETPQQAIALFIALLTITDMECD